jgi:hypothetical protein
MLRRQAGGSDGSDGGVMRRQAGGSLVLTVNTKLLTLN